METAVVQPVHFLELQLVVLLLSLPPMDLLDQYLLGPREVLILMLVPQVQQWRLIRVTICRSIMAMVVVDLVVGVGVVGMGHHMRHPGIGIKIKIKMLITPLCQGVCVRGSGCPHSGGPQADELHLEVVEDHVDVLHFVSHSLNGAGEIFLLLEDLDFVSQLRHDLTCPPTQIPLPLEDVRVHVVAHIENLAAPRLYPQQLVQVLPVAPLEHMTFLQKPLYAVLISVDNGEVGVGQTAVRRVDAEQLQIGVVQKIRFPAADDDDVEEFQPVQAPLLFIVVADYEVHGHMGVVPVAVGQQKHLLAAGSVSLYHGHDVEVGEYVSRGVLCDGLLDGAVAVAHVHAVMHLVEHLGVGREGQVGPGVLQVHQLGEQTRVDQLEEGVDGDIVFLREGRHSIEVLEVERPLLLRVEHPGAVEDRFDVLVPVDLQEVAPGLVDDDTPPKQGRVVLEGEYFLWVAVLVDELLLRPPVAQQVEGHIVLRQGEVHVEADRTDLAHLQLTVAKDVLVARRPMMRHFGFGGGGLPLRLPTSLQIHPVQSHHIDAVLVELIDGGRVAGPRRKEHALGGVALQRTHQGRHHTGVRHRRTHRQILIAIITTSIIAF
mmetsp:Transcript_6409/g.15486  ORF Transcript_6409/g.15486 Transcript_6409/m.15486 type:complete len:601 (-) Transcript_6409:392-2194(-)